MVEIRRRVAGGVAEERDKVSRTGLALPVKTTMDCAEDVREGCDKPRPGPGLGPGLKPAKGPKRMGAAVVVGGAKAPDGGCICSCCRVLPTAAATSNAAIAASPSSWNRLRRVSGLGPGLGPRPGLG